MYNKNDIINALIKIDFYQIYFSEKKALQKYLFHLPFDKEIFFKHLIL